MTQKEANKMILDGWQKERLAEEWVREHIKYNELKQENEKLKELCDKYEEEHNITFKKWQKDIQANKKAIEYMKKYVEVLIFEDGTEIYQVKNGNEFYEGLLDILEGKDEK